MVVMLELTFLLECVWVEIASKAKPGTGPVSLTRLVLYLNIMLEPQ